MSSSYNNRRRSLHRAALIGLLGALGSSYLDSSASAQTQNCAGSQIQSTTRLSLFEDLRASTTEAAGQQITNAIWAHWLTAPDDHAQDLLDRGMTALRLGDYAESEAILGELITYCPNYAEGWNQRAFARYLGNRLDASLQDIEQTLQIEPLHFGALSGRGRIYLQKGLNALAQIAFNQAVAANPWLPERHIVLDRSGQEL